MLKQQPGRQNRRGERYNFRYNFRALYALEKLVKKIEQNNVLTVFSAMIDYRKNKYILVIDTVWRNSEQLAYRYYWEKGKLTITSGIDVIEEKIYNL